MTITKWKEMGDEKNLQAAGQGAYSTRHYDDTTYRGRQGQASVEVWVMIMMASKGHDRLTDAVRVCMRISLQASGRCACIPGCCIIAQIMRYRGPNPPDAIHLTFLGQRERERESEDGNKEARRGCLSAVTGCKATDKGLRHTGHGYQKKRVEERLERIMWPLFWSAQPVESELEQPAESQKGVLFIVSIPRFIPFLLCGFSPPPQI